MSGANGTPADHLHDRGRGVLHAQAGALDAIIHDLHLLDPDLDNIAIRVPLLMLQAVGVSLDSVLALTRSRDMAIRDGFGITRSAVETAVNAAYIAVGGEAIAEQAVRHMRQKRWRDLSREANIGGWRMSVRRDIGLTPDDLPGLPEALEEYTNKRGREIRDWSTATIEERIDAVTQRSRRAGLCVGAAVFAIYRPSSELLHGTYYGVNYFWQGSRERPARSRAAFDHLWLLEHFVTVLSAMFFGTSGVIDAMAAVFDLAAHASRQDELARELTRLIDDMNGLEEA
ncbi:hypothetical protein E2493_07290 [Sphingomonas parva]|uniref:Uncharacterized protein n=1 Tax=Sphingomonas parva TaxID=2555898 RepID=A0A4Y8ZS77_9SPHN|nr:hypothetical protein [Sphingomonas parva]TFI58863.1 hypothetical protein E2493_07290 [Sphingomonas parva]